MSLIKKAAAGTTNHKDTADKKPTEKVDAATAATQTADDIQAQLNEEKAAADAAKAKAAKAAEAKAKQDAEAEAEKEAAALKAKQEAEAKEAQEKAEKEAADLKAKQDAEAAELKEKQEAEAKAAQEKAEKEAAELKAQQEAAETKPTENEKKPVIEDATLVEKSTAEGDVDKNVVADQKEEVSGAGTAVAETANTQVAKAEKPHAMPANVTELAADEGFEGTELGFGSFPIITLPSEGIFNDSDDNELGKHIRAELRQSKECLLYKQEDQKDGPVGYSYDGVNLSAYTGDEEYKTVAEMSAAWTEEGYDVETKKYLEVIATICEDHEDFINGGEVPAELEDLEGEPVIFRIPPSSVKAFSGKVATLTWAGKKIQGAQMDFLVGKKRGEGANKYFPWKFRLPKADK